MFPRSSLFLNVALLVWLTGCGGSESSGHDGPAMAIRHDVPASAGASQVEPPPLATTSTHASVHAQPTKWAGVAAARTQRGLLAAWSGEILLVSRDGGSRFEPVSEGGGTIDHAVFGDDGKLFAMRGSRTLVVVDEKARTTVRGLEFARSTSEIAAGAGTLAWIGSRKAGGKEGVPSLALSNDDGRSWTFPEVTLGSFENHVRIDEDGTVRLLVENEVDCGGGYQTRLVGDVKGGAFKEPGWPLDAPGTATMGDGGWGYGLGGCGDDLRDRLCAVDAEGKPMPAIPAKDAAFKTFRSVSDGRDTWATLDGRLAWLSGDVVMFPALHTPKGLVLDAVDADGRPLGVAHGNVVRFRRDGKWETLL